MTTLTEAREAIYQAFSDGWTPTGNQFTFDNEKFDPPDAAPWARCSVRHSFSSQTTLGKTGNRRFMRLGSVFVQVYTLANDGVRTADGLVNTARAIFEGKTLTGTTIAFRNVIVRETGPEGKWYQFVVEAEFDYEEIK